MRAPKPKPLRTGHRAYAIVLVAVALGIIFAMAAVNFIVDPLQRFRTAAFYPPQYEPQQRLQAPALARSADYDSLIMGTSTAENVFATDASHALGGRFLGLPISGGSPREQRMVLDVALATGKPKRVLWFIDAFAHTQPADLVRDDFGPFPHYMYAGGPAGVSQYLVNFQNLQKSAGIILRLVRGDLPPARDPDRLNAWIDKSTFGREQVLKLYRDAATRAAWAQALNRRMLSDPAVAAATIAENIARPIRSHPTVRFDLILVPPSDAQLAFWAAYFPEFFDAVLSARRLLARDVLGLPNAIVHDFWMDESIAGDLDRYADMIHFDLATTRELLAGVASGGYRADAGSIARSETSLRSRVELFRRINPLD